jgi:hypothetical protein
MVPSVPDAVVRPSDIDNRIVKTVDELLGFVPKEYKKNI